MLLALMILSGWSVLSAQDLQWASSVVDASSQQGQTARQILGAPDARFTEGRWRGVWSPGTEQSFGHQTIRVRFAQAMAADQVIVVECDKPGAIARIRAMDEHDGLHTLYENPYPRVELVPSRDFVAKFPLTNYRITEIQVDLNTNAVRGFNRLDAIGISAGAATERAEFTARGVMQESPFNTPYHEHSPVISADGRTLYFVRRYHPQNVGTEDRDDLWVSRRLPSGVWSRAISVGIPVNTNAHETVVGTSTDGNRVYFLRHSERMGTELFSSRRAGRGYENPRQLNWEALPRVTSLLVADNGSVIGLERDGELIIGKIAAMGDVVTVAQSTLPQPIERLAHLSADGQTLYATTASGQMLLLEQSPVGWIVQRTESVPGAPTGGFTFAAAAEEAFFAEGSAEHFDLSSLPLSRNLQPRRSTKPPLTTPTTTSDLVSVNLDATTRLVYGNRPGYFSSSYTLSSGKSLERLDVPLPSERALRARGGSVTTVSQQDRALQLRRLHTDIERLDQPTKFRVATNFEDRILRPVANGYDYDRESLRRRYEREARQPAEAKSPKQATSEDVADEVRRMRELFNRAHGEQTEYLDFELYERQVVSDLQEEVQTELIEDLYTEVLPDVERELDRLLPDTERDYLERARVVMVSNRSSSKPLASEKAVVTENVSNQIENELRRALEPEVRAELRRQLLPQVREELRRELLLLVKSEFRDDLMEQDAAPISSNEPLPAPTSTPKNTLKFYPLHAGDIIPLEGIFYYPNDAELLPESKAELDRLAQLLTDYPKLTVELAVHTHGNLGGGLSDSLSQTRAAKVRNQLLDRGIPPARIIARGYGARQPITENDTTGGQLTNQRTELRIL